MKDFKQYLQIIQESGDYNKNYREGKMDYPPSLLNGKPDPAEFKEVEFFLNFQLEEQDDAGILKQISKKLSTFINNLKDENVKLKMEDYKKRIDSELKNKSTYTKFEDED